MKKTMKVIGFKEHLPLTAANSLQEFEVPRPQVQEHDLLVEVAAVSVNPVDVGVRRTGHGVLQKPKVLGWDAVGIVKEIGSAVTLFKPGERVFYAGSFKRPGSNSEYQVVDERIVGHAPEKLTDAQAAAVPLTSLTAWEALFEQLEIAQGPAKERTKTILIINGAGGVGSIATQLADWAGLKVIASASRRETIRWVKQHGAQQTVNHRKNLVTEVRNLGYQYVDYILGLSDLDGHWAEIAALIKPSGRIAAITENKRPLDLKKLTKKRAKFAWEWMYTKSYYQTPDMLSQHVILEKMAALLDQGIIKSTVTQELSPFNVANLKRAHELVESNHMMGKVVICEQ